VPGILSSEFYETYWSDRGFSPTGLLGSAVRDLLGSNTKPGDLIADVGCGDGRVVAPWAVANDRRYVGLDIARAAVSLVRAAGFEARLITDPPSLPLEDGSADVATVFEVLEHLVEPQALLTEVRRVLKPGGRVLVTVPNSAYWLRRVELGLFGRFNPYGDAESSQRPWRDPHVRFFTRTSLTRLLGEAAFTQIRTGGHGHPVFSLRTRVEATSPVRLMMRLRPEIAAPSLHATARSD
jgi:SAM-dependent methyltransferase